MVNNFINGDGKDTQPTAALEKRRDTPGEALVKQNTETETEVLRNRGTQAEVLGNNGTNGDGRDTQPTIVFEKRRDRLGEALVKQNTETDTESEVLGNGGTQAEVLGNNGTNGDGRDIQPTAVPVRLKNKRSPLDTGPLNTLDLTVFTTA